MSTFGHFKPTYQELADALRDLHAAALARGSYLVASATESPPAGVTEDWNKASQHAHAAYCAVLAAPCHPTPTGDYESEVLAAFLRWMQHTMDQPRGRQELIDMIENDIVLARYTDSLIPEN